VKIRRGPFSSPYSGDGRTSTPPPPTMDYRARPGPPFPCSHDAEEMDVPRALTLSAFPPAPSFGPHTRRAPPLTGPFYLWTTDEASLPLFVN
jgi:hypothetical protein